jgi:hypothetical protein
MGKLIIKKDVRFELFENRPLVYPIQENVSSTSMPHFRKVMIIRLSAGALLEVIIAIQIIGL